MILYRKGVAAVFSGAVVSEMRSYLGWHLRTDSMGCELRY